MVYTDRYFRFPDEATADQLMPAGNFQNMDVLGHVANQAGQVEAAWCVNLRLMEGEEVTATQAQYEIAAPSFPKRVWA